MSNTETLEMFNTAGLISPPPEEALQIARTSVSKRKRTTPQPQQTTPNPKPRKQSRRPQSPANPKADYLPNRARRTTPIPAYEPPADVFTPPRTVIVTPTISKSSKRKTARSRGPTRDLSVKTEPPHIDLCAPASPPSPTDDPILLSAVSSSPVRPRKRDAAVNTVPLRHTTPPLRHPTPLPPSSPPDGPLFDVTDPSVGIWSDSDDDDDLLAQGEYTGSFRSFSVRTKLDPPSSATRERQQEWGRPITPFPFRKIDPLDLLKEDEPMDQGTPTPPAKELDELSDAPARGPFDFDVSFEEDEPRPTFQVEQAPAQDQSITTINEKTDISQDAVSEPEIPSRADEPEATCETPSHDEGAQERESPSCQDRELPSCQDRESPSCQDRESPSRQGADEQHERTSHEQAEERKVRELSPSLDDEEPSAIATPAPVSSHEDSSSDEEELEYGVVKISSADPHAAARAAAILKQHDYDCFTKLTLRASKRRHSLSDSGITKTRSPRDRMRRRTLGASIIGDKVFIPGSPATTLPELLKEAEAAVSGTPVKSDTSSHLFTPVLKPSTVGFARSLFENAGKDKVWTKDEWKLLDACFTDERIALGSGDGQLAPVDRVHLENVVRRFVDLLGGEDVVYKWGDDWEMESLVERVKALQNKQRKGIVAPPTTPNTPRLNLMDPSASLFTRRLPSMEVPDFTPLGRRAAPPAHRPTLPPPIVTGAPFSDLQDTPDERPKRKLPLSLLAPRYSHLLEEAVTVSQLPDPEPEPKKACDPCNESAAANTSTGTEADTEPSSSVTTETTISNPAPSSTFKTRVKSFLFSYLPNLSKYPAPKPKPSSRPGLPLPPPSVLEKPRGPIATPARAPVPKPTHPKELVHLNPAPVLPKPSMIPRACAKPQRLIELHRVSPPPEKEKPVVVRPRRSSGGSVKDLVRGFEEMERDASVRRAEEHKKGELRRVRSVGEWKKTAGLANAGSCGNKPSWRL